MKLTMIDGRRVTATIRERLEAKLDKSGPPHPVLGTPCWVWTGARKHGSEYGLIQAGAKDAGQLRAHRVSWWLTKGPIPPGKKLCHHCDNPPCCNPDHAFVGTQRDNMMDMIAKGRNVLPPVLFGADHPRWTGGSR